MWVANLLKRSGKHFRTSLIAGLVVALPLGVTFVILKFIFDFLDPRLKPIFENTIDHYTPGMGIAALVVIIYLLGLVTTHVMGRRIIRFGHAVVDRVPVVNTVYKTARQATEVLSSVQSDSRFSSVVLIDFPGQGLRSIGLVTSRLKDQDGTTLLAVYVPTTPFPTSGFLIFLHEDKVTPTDLTVDEAMKLIVSAGIVAPDEIISHPYDYAGNATTPGVSPSTGPRPHEPQVPDSSDSNQ